MTDRAPYQAGLFSLSARDYHADLSGPCLSAGLANLIDKRSPLHAWTASRALNPAYIETKSDAFNLGTACHAMLLEGGANIAWIDPEDYPSKKGDIPDGWTNDAIREARDLARKEGRSPMLLKYKEPLETMCRIAYQRFRQIMDANLIERSLYWQEVKTWCRAKPDAMNGDRSIMLDYKTTSGSAEPDSWIRNHLIPEGHDIRAIHYLRGNHATGGPENAEYLFLVQEAEPPFDCSIIGLAPSRKELGARKWVRAMRTWRHCVESGKWPGYSKQVCYAEAEAWEMNRADERDIREGIEYDPAKLWEGIK